MQLDTERFEREKMFMNEFWKFRKAYGTPEGNDKPSEVYWTNAMSEWDRLAKVCGEDPYCLSLLLVCFADLESRYRLTFGTPSYDENLAFFTEVAKKINQDTLRHIGLEMKFERVV